ncbi:MAG TPA: universal stress protein [Thermoanaerobaculia bacterium]|nr:universal stress protein [Thermoanaerobaculia bacterium]
MIERIVVPVDFSAASCRAARYAVEELAPQLRAEVVFVTVLEASDLRVAMNAGLHGFETDEDLHRQVHDWVEEQFRRIESAGDSVKAKRDVRRGMPEREIVEAIQEHRASIVVMGAAGITKRIPLGSKAEYVLRHIDVPVLLLRAKHEE